MNKKLINIVLSSLCGTFLLAGSLLADVQEQSQKLKNIPVGIRALNPTEYAAMQELRATEDCEDMVEEEINDQAGQLITAVKDDSRLQSKSLTSKLYTYYTTHAGALHWAISVTPFGDSVQLEDGSIWSVSSWDRYKTLNWLSSDTILVAQSSNYFSIYGYKLINVNTGAEVEVNLTLGPIYNSVYTYYIVGIDYFWNEVMLNDGTVWKFFWDDSVMKKWLINDTVIIGINDGAFSGSEPNILINVSMLNYARCVCK